MSKIKSFRGKMSDNTIDTVSLHTNDGSTGYRIKSFTAISSAPGTQDMEAIFKIYKTPQTSADGEVDFSDNTLLGVCYFKDYATNDNQPSIQTIIFDQETFNQDIFVTYTDVRSNKSASYYFELEQIKLDLSENTVATLKDIRNITGQ
tara:strand:- start:69 stop:512 length:444 start_codon:yes stop_codon:yes gene_type:complete